MVDNIEFGRYLSEIRLKNGIETQKELAKMSGLSTATISRIEAGIQKATPEHLKKIASSLKVSYESLMITIGYINNENLIPNGKLLIYVDQDKVVDISELDEESRLLVLNVINLAKQQHVNRK